VLKSRPSDEQARLYRDEAGYQFWVQVLARGGNLSTLGKRILSAAERGAIRERQDDAKMDARLKRFYSDSLEEQMSAQEEIIAVHGHYIVPKLVEALGERREDEQARSRDRAPLAPRRGGRPRPAPVPQGPEPLLARTRASASATSATGALSRSS